MSEGVELAGVSCDFGRFRAVDRVNVTIKAGEFFSFLGPSGCGKTTILRMVSGFIEPSEGEILIGGRNMQGIRPNKRPTALIFQNLALFPLMRVWENITFAMEVKGRSKTERRRRAGMYKEGAAKLGHRSDGIAAKRPVDQVTRALRLQVPRGLPASARLLRFASPRR